MRRREFIAGLGGAVTLPLAARAQQRHLPWSTFTARQSALSQDSSKEPLPSQRACERGLQTPPAEIIRYRTFLGGGELCEARMLALVDRSPEAVEFFESCGIPFRLTGGIVDHYLGVAPGARGSGTLEAELISGFELGAWRDNVRTPRHAPYFVTAEEQYAWGGINRYSTWDQARAALTRIAGFFAKLRTTAEQLTALERWYRILSQALKKFLRARNLVLPRQLRPAGAASYG